MIPFGRSLTLLALIGLAFYCSFAFLPEFHYRRGYENVVGLTDKEQEVYWSVPENPVPAQSDFGTAVRVEFASGHIYELPDTLPYHIKVHRFVPPQNFVDDVLNSTVVSSSRFVIGTKKPGEILKEMQAWPPIRGDTDPRVLPRVIDILANATNTEL